MPIYRKQSSRRDCVTLAAARGGDRIGWDESDGAAGALLESVRIALVNIR